MWRSRREGGRGSTINAQIRSALARRDAASDRRAALADRQAGARARTDAEHDRDAGASERIEAEHDRDAGAIERTEAEHERDSNHDAGAGERVAAGRGRFTAAPQAASLDELTGAYLPDAGFVELDREMARSRRTGQPLTLLTVDVEELETVDEAGSRRRGPDGGRGRGDRHVQLPALRPGDPRAARRVRLRDRRDGSRTRRNASRASTPRWRRPTVRAGRRRPASPSCRKAIRATTSWHGRLSPSGERSHRRFRHGRGSRDRSAARDRMARDASQGGRNRAGRPSQESGT